MSFRTLSAFPRLSRGIGVTMLRRAQAGTVTTPLSVPLTCGACQRYQSSSRLDAEAPRRSTLSGARREEPRGGATRPSVTLSHVTRDTLLSHAHSGIWSSHTNAKQLSTVAGDGSGVFGRVWKGLGFTGKLKYNKKVLQRAGLRLYLCCVELVDYDHFFRELELPDTFNSWFRITELHIWLCMVRLSQEGTEGTFVRNSMVRYMYEDLDKKSRKLGGPASLRSQGIQTLAEQFKVALLTYDEGLMDDDRVLAAALWRQFYETNCHDPQKLELLVHYVRKQVLQLDGQEAGVLLTSGLVELAPLSGDEDKQRTKQILRDILHRV